MFRWKTNLVDIPPAVVKMMVVKLDWPCHEFRHPPCRIRLSFAAYLISSVRKHLFHTPPFYPAPGTERRCFHPLISNLLIITRCS